jgi:autoinducer 2 (AI-2) kinase
MKALITAPFDPDCLDRLGAHMEVQHEDYRRTGKIYFDDEELVEKLDAVGADVLIVEADLVHEEVFEAYALKIIGCCRGDPLNISAGAATKQGVPIFYAPGRNADAVADFTLGLILSLVRNVVTMNLRLRGGQVSIESTKDIVEVFNQYGGYELASATVGLVGFGRVGRKVAQRLEPFGSRMIVYDPFVSPEELAVAGVMGTPLDDLLEQADVISLHVPENDDTHHLIGDREFRLMKPDALFVNTARSFVTDEQALLDSLREGRIGGAALDVFDEEPLQGDNPFLGLDNVICTPHLAGATRDVVRHQSEMITRDIIRYLGGKSPAHIWNPSVLKQPPDYDLGVGGNEE